MKWRFWWTMKCSESSSQPTMIFSEARFSTCLTVRSLKSPVTRSQGSTMSAVTLM